MKETITKNIDPRQLNVFNDYLSTLDGCDKANAITYHLDDRLAAGSDVKVTVLPPGETLGARDLQRWSLRRMNGQAGVPLTRKERDWLNEKPKLDLADRWLAQAEKKKNKRPRCH